MKKVLIALDYNPAAEKVAKLGYDMAVAMDAETTLLHVMSDPVYYSSADYSPIMGFTGYSDLTFENMENAIALKESTQNFLDHAKMILHDDNIHTLIKEGDFVESILEAAVEVNADIIVLGTHEPSFGKTDFGATLRQGF